MNMSKLSRFERTRLISARALQLSLGAPPLLETKKEDTSYDIAKRELTERVLPMAVIRRYPNGTVERVELK